MGEWGLQPIKSIAWLCMLRTLCALLLIYVTLYIVVLRMNRQICNACIVYCSSFVFKPLNLQLIPSFN